MKNIVLFIVCLISVIPVCGRAGEALGVVVRDSQFNVVHKIENKSELKQFEEIWSTKHEVILRAMPNWTHKLDIKPGGRWLYHPNGFTMFVSMSATGIFKIDNSLEFNALLKIDSNQLNQAP